MRQLFKSFLNKPVLLQHLEEGHFQHGFLSRSNDTFFVRLGILRRKPQTPLIEAKYAAIHIYENRKGLPLQLCLSGGIDSEAMMASFLEANVPFEAVFLRFKNQLNQFDIKTNVAHCEAQNIPHRFIDIDILNFFESGKHLAYGKNYRCQSPQLAVHLWLLDQLDGLPIMSGNPICPIDLKGQPFFVGLPGDLHCAMFRYFENTNRAGVPWFFLYSPELSASMLQVPILNLFVTGQIASLEKYDYQTKCASYQQGGFNVLPRENKFTGFEAVKEHYEKIDNTQYGTAFDQRYREPLKKMNPFPEHYIQQIPVAYFQL